MCFIRCREFVFFVYDVVCCDLSNQTLDDTFFFAIFGISIRLTNCWVFFSNLR